MDLSRVTFPTFVLEPPQHARAHNRLYVPSRSYLRVRPLAARQILIKFVGITQRRGHGGSRGALFTCPSILPRRMAHQAKGVKKPCVPFFSKLDFFFPQRAYSYNPILGEFFRCRYDYPMAPTDTTSQSKSRITRPCRRFTTSPC